MIFAAGNGNIYRWQGARDGVVELGWEGPEDCKIDPEVAQGQPSIQQWTHLTCCSHEKSWSVCWSAQGAICILYGAGLGPVKKCVIEVTAAKPESRLAAAASDRCSNIFIPGDGKCTRLNCTPRGSTNNWKWDAPEELLCTGKPSLKVSHAVIFSRNMITDFAISHQGKIILLEHPIHLRWLRIFEDGDITFPGWSEVDLADVDQIAFEVKDVGDDCLAFYSRHWDRWLRVTPETGGIEARMRGTWDDSWRLERFKIRNLKDGEISEISLYNPESERWLGALKDGIPNCSNRGSWWAWWKNPRLRVHVVGLAPPESPAHEPGAVEDLFPRVPRITQCKCGMDIWNHCPEVGNCIPSLLCFVWTTHGDSLIC